MFSILEPNQHNLVIQSLSFNDQFLDMNDDQTLNVNTKIQSNKKYYSLDLKKIRVDCSVSYVGMIDNMDVAFTLNALVRVVFNVKNGVTEKELDSIINDGSDENLKNFNELVAPIIQKEINDFLTKTDYSIS